MVAIPHSSPNNPLAPTITQPSATITRTNPAPVMTWAVR
jgi:hypothetical protein